MEAMFLPPNAAFRHRAAFLASVQGKRPLYTYVHELRRLRAAMADSPLAEDVMVTVFMQGLNSPAADAYPVIDGITLDGLCIKNN
jgi:hypothetical protein